MPTSKSQIIPSISIDFNIDADDINQYLDSTLNPDRPRIRVTENLITTYYLMEDEGGRVTQDYPYPVTGGRAYAGRVVDFPLATYVNLIDTPMASFAQQICVEDIQNQAGEAISVIWLATQNPTIPGRRIELSRADRLGTLRDLARSCGAGVRVSQDGMGFEVFDIPLKALSASADFDYDNAFSLSYAVERIDKPINAIRVKGAAFDYSIGKLPTINVWAAPDTMPADGTSSTTGFAQVFGEDGKAVSHVSIVDEAIDADSFTTIPVSGCFAVQAVWLNSGTQSVPVKGARVDVTTFDASTITVPVQVTDLFIVSYTQAESVSWAVEDYADRVEGEAQDTTGTLAVVVDNNLGQVEGVYLASDERRIGTNFYTGGTFTENTTTITLGISPGATGTAVLVDYVKYNASPLTGVNVSPSSSLCNANGIAGTTIGSGTAVGAGYLVASALGQQGFANLSLTGSGVGFLSLQADPGRIRMQIEDASVVNEYVGEVGTVTVDATGTYILADNQVLFPKIISVTGYPSAEVTRWSNEGGEYKIFVQDAAGGTIPNGTASTIRYEGFEVVSEEDKTSTITATVRDTSGDPATDGTVVLFEIRGSKRGCVLSASSATTTDGVAEVTLTSGERAGLVTVRAATGGFKADVDIEITVDDVIGNPTAPIYGDSGGWSWETEIDRRERTGEETCKQVPNDNNDVDGSVSGSRRLVGCEGEPLAGAIVTMGGVTSTTDAEGWFTFANGSSGSNSITVNGKSYSFNIAAKDSEARGGFKAVCTDDNGQLTYEGPIE